MQAASRVMRFDDSFGLVSCHGVGRVLGMLLVGIFAHYTINPSGLTGSGGTLIDGSVFGGAALLGHQAIAAAVVVAFTMGVTYGVAQLVHATVGLRVSEDEEDLLGLNVSFDAAAYGP